MDACAILKALLHHHTTRASDNLTIDTNDCISKADNTLISNVSGKHMADLFADAALEELTTEECYQLIAFLHVSDASSPILREQLQQQVDDRIQCFYKKETSKSGWGKESFGKPSGREDAELIVILHLQTRKPDPDPWYAFIRDFWDTTSFTIKALEVKGFNTDILFGYDWHWRAEETMSKRGVCSATKWPPAVKQLHDDLSSSLFTTLPGRFA